MADTRSAWATYNGYVPKMGPKAIGVSFVLVANVSQDIDLAKEELVKQLDFVQTLFIDNSQGTGTITINSKVHNQRLAVPPSSLAYLPVLSADQSQFTITSTSNATVPVSFINVPMPAIVWNTVTPTLAVGVIPKSATQAKVTIAVGATYQQALAQNLARVGATLQNNSAAVMYLFFGAASPGVDLTTGFQLQPGQTMAANVGGLVCITDKIWVAGTLGGVMVTSEQ